VAAFGMGGEWSLGVALIMEVWPASRRALLAGIIGAAANVGYALIAVVALCFQVTQGSWRWVMIAGAAPALLALGIQLMVPESERWKAAVNERVARPLREIFSAGLLPTTLLAIAFASVALIGTWGSVQWLPLWADQLTGGKVFSAKATTQLFSALGAIVGCLAERWRREDLGGVRHISGYACCHYCFAGCSSVLFMNTVRRFCFL